MPRLPRITLEGAVYYVTSRGLNGQELFRDASDYATYLELLKKYKEQHRFKLFSYLLLPQKIELLIETGSSASISEIMHDLNSLYTKYFNGRYDRKGHLFEARFRSSLVEKATSLLRMTRHIHTGTDSAQAYSSRAAYLAQPSPAVLPLDLHEEIMEVLAQLRAQKGELSYADYCTKADPQEISEFTAALKRSKIIGSETFIAKAQEKISQRTAQLESEESAILMSPQRRNFYIGAFTLAAVLAAASVVYLYSGKRSADSKYQSLLQAKELEFKNRTRFENLNPLSPSSLEGTEWVIEINSPQGTTETTIRFQNGRFSSTFFNAKGFKDSSYFLVPQAGKTIVWQAAQASSSGDTLSWRGAWQGEVMKGQLSYRMAGKDVQEYSFFSKKWLYFD